MDMFSSPGNKQLDHFVSRHPHWSLGGIPRGCIALPTRPSASLLCQPPMDDNPAMAHSPLGEPTSGLHDHSFLLGFRCTVAPTSQTASARVQGSDSTPLSRDVPQLLGRTIADPRWPLLCVVLSGRCFREGKFRLRASKLTQMNMVPLIATSPLSTFCGFNVSQRGWSPCAQVIPGTSEECVFCIFINPRLGSIAL